VATPRAWAVQPAAASLVCLCGVRGMGKSTWLREYLRDVRRLVLWDPMREGNFGGGSITVAELARRVPALHSGVIRYSVYPTRFAAMDEEFDTFCECAWRIGAVCVAVEEISLVASPNAVPENFGRCVAQGRHRGLSLVVVSQRFAQVPRLATANASRIIAYRQSEPRDVRDLCERVGELGEQVKDLPKHAYLDWTPDAGARLRAPLRVT
jgi:DNA helicase HerA-like ATPase